MHQACVLLNSFSLQTFMICLISTRGSLKNTQKMSLAGALTFFEMKFKISIFFSTYKGFYIQDSDRVIYSDRLLTSDFEIDKCLCIEHILAEYFLSYISHKQGTGLQHLYNKLSIFLSLFCIRMDSIHFSSENNDYVLLHILSCKKQ